MTEEEQAAAQRAEMRNRMVADQIASSGPNADLVDAELVVDTAIAICDAVGATFQGEMEQRMKGSDDVLTLSLPIVVLATQLCTGMMQNMLGIAITQARGLGLKPGALHQVKPN